MSQSSQPNPANSVAFEVEFEEKPSEKRRAAPPKRLQMKQRRADKQDIDAKLQRAAEKKKLQEDQRLARIQARQEHCHKMATKMGMLLDQDAKRRGAEGTENIPAMSRRQAAAVIRSVAKDFESMGSEMQQTSHVPEEET